MQGVDFGAALAYDDWEMVTSDEDSLGEEHFKFWKLRLTHRVLCRTCVYVHRIFADLLPPPVVSWVSQLCTTQISPLAPWDCHGSRCCASLQPVKTKYFGKVTQHHLLDKPQGSGLIIMKLGMAVHHPISINPAAVCPQQQLRHISVMLYHHDQCQPWGEPQLCPESVVNLVVTGLQWWNWI